MGRLHTPRSPLDQRGVRTRAGRVALVTLGAVVVTAGGFVAACGLDRIGARPDLTDSASGDAGAAGGGDAGHWADARGGDEGAAPSPRCDAVCDAGRCDDAGACVVDCSARDACPGGVVCPVGVPCKVTCGDFACGGGVDCGESAACEVACAGDHACDAPVRCGGATCDVRCAGPNSCADVVYCDAGARCAVACTAFGACAGGVRARAEDAVVRCTAMNACSGRVACGAPGSCVVECAGYGACNGAVDANGARSTDVRCNAPDSCGSGVHARSDLSAIACSGQFSCPRPVTCDGGRCALDCSNSRGCQFCCAAATCDAGGASWVTSGACP